MLSRVLIQNFKSIGEPGVDLELKPLTFLVGPNGGGKSSVLEAIALISQSVDKQLQLKGELVEFSAVTDISHKGESDRWFRVEVALDNSKPTYTLELRHDTGEAKQTITDEHGDFVRISLEGDRRLGFNLSAEDRDGSSKLQRVDFMNILYSGHFGRREQDAARTSGRDMKHFEQIAERMASCLQSGDAVFHLSALRGAVPFAVAAQSMPKWVGTKGENLLSILAFAEQPRYDPVRGKIAGWASKFELLSLKAGLRGPNTAGFIGADFVDRRLKVPLNLALASHGSRQIAVVITQLFWSRPGSLLMIEEPESSLHLEKQILLPELFADAIRDGKQILATTHSSFLLLAISKAVQKELIKASDIAIYEVSKTAQGTRVKGLPLTPKGYLNRWVPTFTRVESKLLREWVDNLPEK